MSPKESPGPLPRRIRLSGGYRGLRSFQAATMIYDATAAFCEQFVDKRSRTSDQMVQAARSGRQNIAEGSRAAATSSQTELRLVNVARASPEAASYRPAADLMNSCLITRISCDNGVCRNGARTRLKRCVSGRWGG